MEIKQNSLTTGIYIPTKRENKLLKCLESGKAYGSISDLCADAKITRDVWYDAIKKENFVAHLVENNKTLLYAAFPSIISRIVKQAQGGSFIHQKMILEMLKVYSGDSNPNQINIVIPIMGGKSIDVVQTDDSNKKDIQSSE